MDIKTNGPVATAELSGIGARASDVELGFDGAQAETAKVKVSPEAPWTKRRRLRFVISKSGCLGEFCGAAICVWAKCMNIKSLPHVSKHKLCQFGAGVKSQAGYSK
jgi:hypothetical protein